MLNAPIAPQRYLARWVNGFWVTFDTRNWKHVAIHNYMSEAHHDASARSTHG